MAIMTKRTKQKGKGATMPLRLILIHVYADCAFNINFERGWGNKTVSCSKCRGCHLSPFLKAFKIAAFSQQIFRWGGPPLPVTVTSIKKREILLSSFLWPPLCFTYYGLLGLVNLVYGNLKGNTFNIDFFFFSELWFKGQDNVKWYSILTLLEIIKKPHKIYCHSKQRWMSAMVTFFPWDDFFFCVYCINSVTLFGDFFFFFSRYSF